MSGLVERALRWYGQSARDLPWRRPGVTPWGVLVSEVMLQQTPVARVEAAFLEWMRRWPTPADLAREPAGEAIRAWGRLGYPRRALRLHQTAVALVTHHDGRVPPDVAALERLPGIGSYTARAVAAFAYGQRQPVVDTNVRRLVARACAGLADGGAATRPRDLAAVTELLPVEPDRAARASAALMELGAVVCTARSPACDSCPIRAMCRWRAAGRPAGDGIRRSPGYLGTDRYVRGLVMDLARKQPVLDWAAVRSTWTDPDQCDRALTSLVADGLLVEVRHGRYALPGGMPTG